MREVVDELEEVEVEGHRAWMLASETTESWPQAQDVVWVLPHFDCYLIGCHPRDRLVPAWAKRALTPGGIGNLPLVVVDGVVAGLWQQRQKGRRLEVRVELFQPFSSRHHQELQAAVEHVREIVEAESDVLTSEVSPSTLEEWPVLSRQMFPSPSGGSWNEHSLSRWRVTGPVRGEKRTGRSSLPACQPQVTFASPDASYEVEAGICCLPRGGRAICRNRLMQSR